MASGRVFSGERFRRTCSRYANRAGIAVSCSGRPVASGCTFRIRPSMGPQDEALHGRFSPRRAVPWAVCRGHHGPVKCSFGTTVASASAWHLGRDHRYRPRPENRGPGRPGLRRRQKLDPVRPGTGMKLLDEAGSMVGLADSLSGGSGDAGVLYGWALPARRAKRSEETTEVCPGSCRQGRTCRLYVGFYPRTSCLAPAGWETGTLAFGFVSSASVDSCTLRPFHSSTSRDGVSPAVTPTAGPSSEGGCGAGSGRGGTCLRPGWRGRRC
ncbi:hypothetical protein OEIGOIKO_07410 [Streptomyces chrestomyceticus JCM 4735]|uniref:Uncharacterized protein n=1 Tax=Streptomyces chrestomyceticus JCM 4735 TaxID=1306181 RepID=A0A7U9L1Z4_9ACTN|nr:hypothetical protein OEIGOIKO_07410 [Streptomyces chrestomyceticus JCM 4735]